MTLLNPVINGGITQAGLIKQEKLGRHIFCTPNYPQIKALLQFLHAEFQVPAQLRKPVQQQKPAQQTARPTKIKSTLKKATIIPGY